MRSAAVIALAACGGSAPAPVENAVGSATVAVAVDPHAQIAVNGAGVFAVVDGRLVRYDHGLHRLGEVDRKVVFQPRSGPASTERARSVTATAERVFAGFDTGLVAEIDPHTLAPRMITVMAKPPTWLRVYRDRLLVASEYGLVSVALANPDDSRGLVLPRPDIPYRSAPTTYLLDGDTLWFGLDGGEWGGGFGMYDLATQRSCVTGTEHGVYGFARAGDRVLVHGGVVHLGVHAGYVAAAAGCTLEPRWTGDTPVVAMVAHGDGFRIIEWNDIDDVTPDFARFRRIGTVPATPSSGRPDAMGGYPGITGVLALPDVLVIATRTDGLFAVRGDHVVSVY